MDSDYPSYPPLQQQQQQQQQQTVVVMNQPSSHGSAAAPQNIREWSTGLCGCFEDCCSCMYAYCCYQCFLCTLSTQLDECYCGPLCCQLAFVVPMRTKVRTMYGIRGSICKDICTVVWCDFCATTQMHRQLKNMGHSGF